MAAKEDSFSIYFAGALFDHKELFGNRVLAKYIDQISEQRYRCVLPQDLEQAVARNADIRNQDLLQVMSSDLALFNFDGTELDSGTVVEMMYAKLLDIPAVILRTDFRSGGDGLKDGDPWNLMCSAYPRTKIILVHGISFYQEAVRMGGTEQEIQDRIYNRLAKMVIDNLDIVRQEKPVSAGNVNVQALYEWALRFPGAALQDTPQTFVQDTLRRKIDKGLL